MFPQALPRLGCTVLAVLAIVVARVPAAQPPATPSTSVIAKFALRDASVERVVASVQDFMHVKLQVDGSASR